MGKLNLLLHLVSLHFGKAPGANLQHSPYHLHKYKLNGIRLRFNNILTDISEICDTKLNEKNLTDNAADILEGGERIIQSLLPMMSNECHQIQCLITVVKKDGYYDKFVATQIVKSFPKGSGLRATVSTALREEGRIPSERSMSRQLQWCETPMSSCKMERPITDQRWVNKGGRKRKGLSGEWLGSVFLDVYPVEIRLAERSSRPYDELMTPIITLDLFSTAKRVDVCDYIHEKMDVRLYFCPLTSKELGMLIHSNALNGLLCIHQSKGLSSWVQWQGQRKNKSTISMQSS